MRLIDLYHSLYGDQVQNLANTLNVPLETARDFTTSTITVLTLGSSNLVIPGL